MNSIIEAVLKSTNFSSDNLSKVRMVDLLIGFVNLLTIKDATLATKINNDQDIEEIKRARNFFQENNLDANLIKNTLSYIERFLKNGVSEGWDTQEYTNYLLQQPSIQIHSVLKKIIFETGLPLEIFAIGKTLDDVRCFQKKLIEEEKKTKQNSDKTQALTKASSENQEVDLTIQVEQHKTNEMPQVVKSKEAEKPVYNRENFLSFAKQYSELPQKLLDNVKGQNYAVHEFVQGLFQSNILSENNRKKPKGVFLFVGPSGVGKAFLAKETGRQLHLKTIICDMSGDEGNIFKFLGKDGALVKFINENPQSILIFDKIEEASTGVINRILQILDEGCFDNGSKTDFTNTTIIFTSNAGAPIYEETPGDISKTPKHFITKAIQEENLLSKEIYSRIKAENVILFNHLSVSLKIEKINDCFVKIADEVKNSLGYELTFAPKLALLFMLHFGQELEEETLTPKIEKFIKDVLFDLSIQLKSHPELMDGVEKIALDVDLDHKSLDPEIYSLFSNDMDALQFAIICRAEDRERFISTANCQMIFAETEDELEKALQNQVTAIFVDPWFGFTDTSARGISVDDFDTKGISIINKVLDTTSTPLYLIKSNNKITEADLNTFYRKGITGVLSIWNKSSDAVADRMQALATELQTEEKIQKFIKQRFVIDFNAAQNAERDTLYILFHSLKKRKVVSNDEGKLIPDSERPTTRFNDVIGAEDAKKELRYFIDYLRNPRGFRQKGSKPPKGVLLYGPPGTGKTMLARAMAGESKVAFIPINATEFMNRYVGQSEQNVRELFAEARKQAPAIIFIDEIDAIGKQRTQEDKNYTNSVLISLMTELDGFKVDLRNPVFVLAATNFKDSLDKALLRRFDNQIYVDLPNETERFQYLELATKNKGFIDINEEVLRNVATRTTGLSIALLENIVDLALRSANNRDQPKPTGIDLQEAVEEYNFGQKHEWSQEYYDRVAIHESGHAYIAYLSGETPSYMTIVSRGDFGGYTQHENAEEKPSYTKEELLWKIRCALAGRAAEEAFEEDLCKKDKNHKKGSYLNTGAGSDLPHATILAEKMICELAMFDEIQMSIPFDKLLNSPIGSQYVDRINELLKTEAEITRELIKDGKGKIERLVEELLKKNHLTGDEIVDILGNGEKQTKESQE